MRIGKAHAGRIYGQVIRFRERCAKCQHNYNKIRAFNEFLLSQVTQVCTLSPNKWGWLSKLPKKMQCSIQRFNLPRLRSKFIRDMNCHICDSIYVSCHKALFRLRVLAIGTNMISNILNCAGLLQTLNQQHKRRNYWSWSPIRFNRSLADV